MIPPAALDSLYGLAHGDAFGDRWFFASREEREGAIAHRVTPRDVPWYWTDDTAQALVLFGHLTANGGSVGQDALAAGLAGAYAADPYRKYGPSMHDVLRRVGAGEPWADVVAEQFGGQGSYGNGAAMRVAPLGAWLAADPEGAAEAAAAQAAVSHHHPEAAAGAVAVALAAAFAARSRGGPAPRDLLAAVADRVPDSDVRSGLRTAGRFPEGTSVRHAAEVLGSGYGVSAPDTVPFALWCAARHLDDLEGGLWETVAGLGDMDTTCAIAGGVIAARTGIDELPPAWRAALEPLPDWVPGPSGETA
ncbi:ADP-ribosylglycohydrolase family protein [Actinacidiphila glaucinigra]|uniref:ADP-ribosylglycohydrolase family protein n=1 Tax=Actinacidiphila glaucinigra TaxID=235986 RepID=UPI0029B200A8|nr:ADP-ribosylglycohydrolase family protein [Streptomyces sp. PA03-3a]